MTGGVQAKPLKGVYAVNVSGVVSEQVDLYV
ncbi:hypothetical protein BH18ACT6_BH18ACT6_23660 [soil metagenome]